MTPLGIGIIGTGNIAGGYARDALTHPTIGLVALTDLDPERAVAFAKTHGGRAHATIDDLLADPAVDIVVNLTVHHAHYEITKRALLAGRPSTARSRSRCVPARRVNWSIWLLSVVSDWAALRRPSSVRRSRRPQPGSRAAVSAPFGPSTPR